MDMVSSELVITATEFKARCLELFTRLNEGGLRKVTVTRRGKPVAEVVRHVAETDDVTAGYGSMRDVTYIPDGFDLTAPIFEGEIEAEKGVILGG